MTKAEIARQNGKKGGRPRKQPKPAELPAVLSVSGNPAETDAHRITSETPKPSETQETQKTQETDALETEETQKPDTDVLPASSKLEALPPKHRLFVELYCGVAGFNASKAYEAAGFTANRFNAARLLAQEEIGEAVKERVDELARVARGDVMDGAEALRHLTRIGRSDIGAVLHPDDPIAKLPEDVRRTIKTVRPTKFGRVIELYDALSANLAIAKGTGTLSDRHEVHVKHTLEDIVAGAALPQSSSAA